MAKGCLYLEKQETINWSELFSLVQKHYLKLKNLFLIFCIKIAGVILKFIMRPAFEKKWYHRLFYKIFFSQQRPLIIDILTSFAHGSHFKKIRDFSFQNLKFLIFKLFDGYLLKKILIPSYFINLIKGKLYINIFKQLS